MRILTIASGPRSGPYNMALDEALLETVRGSSSDCTEPCGAFAPGEPVLIVRTYRWEELTLSLGVNQSVRDVRDLLTLYSWEQPVQQVVRRPTGGRAILHGQDISFSFVTNAPEILRESLKAAYARFAAIIRETLLVLDVPVRISEEAGTREYLRSPVCFETHTPSDLVSLDGRKLSGSAQLRRAGGLLQHGAVFLQAYGVADDNFSRILFEETARHLGTRAEAFPLAAIEPCLRRLEAAYIQESGEILENVSTTSGSHLAPASC